jgi:type IV secretory pathway TrbL component
LALPTWIIQLLESWMGFIAMTGGWKAVLSNLGNILLFALAALMVWASFGLMALHVLIGQVMFYLGAAFVLIFIAFGVFTSMSFLAERAIGSVISSAVRLGMMAAVVGTAFPIISVWAMPNPASGLDPTMRQAFTFTAAAVGVFLLTWIIPAWSASLFEGGAVLTGQGLVTGVGSAAVSVIRGAQDVAAKGSSSLLKQAA